MCDNPVEVAEINVQVFRRIKFCSCCFTAFVINHVLMNYTRSVF